MERQAVTVWPITETRDEDSLVTAARGGDRAAFERTYERGWSQHPPDAK